MSTQAETTVSLNRRPLKAIWWLIQINAVLWFWMIGTFLNPDSPGKMVGAVLFGLLIAALLEIVAYKSIYKGTRETAQAQAGAQP